MATKKSGANIPDAQRHTARLTLRLPPDVAAELRRRAVGHPRGLAGVVAELLATEELARDIILRELRRKFKPEDMLTKLVLAAEADDALKAAGMRTDD